MSSITRPDDCPHTIKEVLDAPLFESGSGTDTSSASTCVGPNCPGNVSVARNEGGKAGSDHKDDVEALNDFVDWIDDCTFEALGLESKQRTDLAKLALQRARILMWLDRRKVC